MRPTTAATLALIITALVACADTADQPPPTLNPAVRTAVQAYAACWSSDSPGSPHRVAIPETLPREMLTLRCRHLEPGPSFYQKLDAQGTPKYRNARGDRIPHYRYSPDLHRQCIQTHIRWFEQNQPPLHSTLVRHFAEAVCAPPPLQPSPKENDR